MSLHQPLNPLAEQLRLALLDRATLVQHDLPSLLAQPLQPGHLPSAAWAQALETTLDTILPAYLNHLHPARPPWTESTLLAATSSIHRLRVRAGYPFLVDWFQQHLHMLSLLRSLPHPHYTIATDLRTGTGPDWATAIADFTAQPWTFAGDQQLPAHLATADPDGNVLIRRYRVNLHLDQLPPAAELYTYGVFLAPVGDYHNSDYPTTIPGQPYLLYHQPASPAPDLQLQLGYSDEVSLPEPAPGEAWSWQLDHLQIMAHHPAP